MTRVRASQDPPDQRRPVAVGGDAPITVQSMTITKTADVEGTLQQIYALARRRCDIVRCTCNEVEAAEGLAQIVPRSPVPIVADIHHQYRMALAALEAGVHGLRLNPGNIRRPSTSRPWRERRRTAACRSASASTAARSTPTSTRSTAADHARGHGRVGAAGDGLLRRGRLRRRQDLGEGVERAPHDRGLPAARRRHRPPLHLGVTEAGPAARRAGEGHRRHRDAARRGHRRHDPLLAHRRSGRGGPRRPPAARGARPARAQERRPDRLPVVRPGRDRRDRRGPPGHGGLRRSPDPAAGRGHGLRGERSGRGARPTSASPPATSGATCS